MGRTGQRAHGCMMRMAVGRDDTLRAVVDNEVDDLSLRCKSVPSIAARRFVNSFVVTGVVCFRILI